jgi:hypothetical protein
MNDLQGFGISIRFEKGLSMIEARAVRLSAERMVQGNSNDAAFQYSFSSDEKMTDSEDSDISDSDTSLNDAARDEREYVRRRLQTELGRKPSEEEVDEWLRRHTEGY